MKRKNNEENNEDFKKVCVTFKNSEINDINNIFNENNFFTKQNLLYCLANRLNTIKNNLKTEINKLNINDLKLFEKELDNYKLILDKNRDIHISLQNNHNDYKTFLVDIQDYNYIENGDIFLHLNTLSYNYLDNIKKELLCFLEKLIDSISNLVNLKNNMNNILNKLPENNEYNSFIDDKSKMML